MSLIKKDQIKYGNNQDDYSIIKPSSQKYKLNLSIPREKIEEEINILKKELMKETEAFRLQLDKEKELLKLKEREFTEKIKSLDDEKQAFFSDIEGSKQKVIKEAYEKGYKEGSDKGYADGEKKGEASGRAEHDKARKNYEDALFGLMEKFKELDEYKKDILKNTEPFLINLLDVIVKKLLSRSIEVDKNIMLEVVREALLPVTSGHDLKIIVNPENVQYLEANKSKLLSEFMSIKECKIEADSNVSQGGCLIEANFGVIDSRIESKMQSIKDLICSLKDCDVKSDAKPEKVVDSIAETKKTGDDLFHDSKEIMTYNDNPEEDVFEFLTDDD